MALNKLAADIYNNAVAHGFDDNTLQIRGALIEAKADNLVGAFNNMVISQRIALIHSELSEALEALRKGNFAELSKADAILLQALLRLQELSTATEITRYLRAVSRTPLFTRFYTLFLTRWERTS